jgi:OHCU decarboxylase
MARLNGLPPAGAAAAFLACCGSEEWARRLAAGRPYREVDALLDAADRTWWELGPADWRQAFAAHPRIGERKPEGSEQHRRWSAQEQAGAAAADAAVRSELAQENRVYEERFGFIFIVCATGKSAAEMLALLRARLANDPETEIEVAAEEQRKITRLRLLKWLEGA